MTEITATDFSRNLSAILDRVEHQHEEIIITRNNHQVARVLPGTTYLTAREVMGDLYRTLPEDAGRSWVTDGKISGAIKKEIKN